MDSGSSPALADVTAPPSTGELLSIGEVSARTGLSTHTLRFYEQEGLVIGPVRRYAAGRRLLTAEEVTWLRVCTELRSSGMPLAPIHRYGQLVREGPGTVDGRLHLLQEHEAKVRRQVADLQEALAVIHGEVELHSRHLAAGTADELWRDGPECDAGPSDLSANAHGARRRR